MTNKSVIRIICCIAQQSAQNIWKTATSTKESQLCIRYRKTPAFSIFYFVFPTCLIVQRSSLGFPPPCPDLFRGYGRLQFSRIRISFFFLRAPRAYRFLPRAKGPCSIVWVPRFYRPFQDVQYFLFLLVFCSLLSEIKCNIAAVIILGADLHLENALSYTIYFFLILFSDEFGLTNERTAKTQWKETLLHASGLHNASKALACVA